MGLHATLWSNLTMLCSLCLLFQASKLILNIYYDTGNCAPFNGLRHPPLHVPTEQNTITFPGNPIFLESTTTSYNDQTRDHNLLNPFSPHSNFLLQLLLQINPTLWMQSTWSMALRRNHPQSPRRKDRTRRWKLVPARFLLDRDCVRIRTLLQPAQGRRRSCWNFAWGIGTLIGQSKLYLVETHCCCF